VRLQAVLVFEPPRDFTDYLRILHPLMEAVRATRELDPDARFEIAAEERSGGKPV
jgi:hypothetical protein